MKSRANRFVVCLHLLAIENQQQKYNKKMSRKYFRLRMEHIKCNIGQVNTPSHEFFITAEWKNDKNKMKTTTFV